MNRFRVLFQMVRADLLERVRRYNFLLTLGFSVYLGYAAYAGYISLQLNLYRGVSNSAWRGSVIGLVSTALLSLIGFYVVKNAIQRDRESRVGLILAATPVSKTLYMFSKALSNFAVLGSMILILAAATLIIQIMHKGTDPLNIFALLSPVLIFGLCALGVTASIAVLFETISALRGSGGNIVYFVLWIALLTMSATTLSGLHPESITESFLDYAGIGAVSHQMQAQLHLLDPQYKDGFTFNIGSYHAATKTFLWTGLSWSPALVLDRVFWIGVAIGLVLLAAALFDRFDPEGAFLRSRPSVKQPADLMPEEKISSVQSIQARNERPRTFEYNSLLRTRLSPRLITLVRAELKLLLNGRRWWWYTVAISLFAGCLIAPLNISRSILMVAAWLWPVPMWSQLGTRETDHNTGSLIFSAPHAIARQFLASWTAGFILAAMTGGGFFVRLVLVGDFDGLATWIAAALFIPALALALGVWVESRKPFEALYTAWLYVGPLHHIRYLDFIGTEPASSTPICYLVASLILLLIAYLWRRMRLWHGRPA